MIFWWWARDAKGRGKFPFLAEKTRAPGPRGDAPPLPTLPSPRTMDSDSLCAVCASGSTSPDPLLRCGSCGVHVHQQCFGLAAAPDAWQCATCEAGVEAACSLCPVKGGLLKPALDGQSWAHLVCLLWTPGSRLDHSMRPTSIVVPLSGGAACEICGSSDGVTRSCAEPKCAEQLHPMCAKRQGYPFHAEGISCARHQPGGGAAKGQRKKAKGGTGRPSSEAHAFKDGLPPAEQTYAHLIRGVNTAMDDRDISQSEASTRCTAPAAPYSLHRTRCPHRCAPLAPAPLAPAPLARASQPRPPTRSDVPRVRASADLPRALDVARVHVSVAKE